MPLFEDLLRRRRAKFGDDYPDTFVTAFNLGVNYRDAGKIKEAVAVFDEWLPRATVTLKPGQPPLPIARQAAAATYARAGRHDKVIVLKSEDVAALRKQAKPDDPDLATALVELGAALLAADKPIDAEPILRECLAIREKIQPDVWTTFLTKSQLGSALLKQKKYADAEPLLRQGYEGMKAREAKIPNVAKACLREAVERLVQLYDAIGNQDEAARWRKELEGAKAPAKPVGDP